MSNCQRLGIWSPAAVLRVWAGLSHDTGQEASHHCAICHYQAVASCFESPLRVSAARCPAKETCRSPRRVAFADKVAVPEIADGITPDDLSAGLSYVTGT